MLVVKLGIINKTFVFNGIHEIYLFVLKYSVYSNLKIDQDVHCLSSCIYLLQRNKHGSNDFAAWYMFNILREYFTEYNVDFTLYIKY